MKLRTATVSASVLLLALAGCGQQADGDVDALGVGTDGESGSFGSGSASDLDEELRATLEELQEQTGVRGGVVVRDEESGEEIAIDDDFTVRAASTAKVVIAMARFQVASEGGAEVTEADDELMRRALVESDNEATQALYGALGETTQEQAQKLAEVYGLLGVELSDDTTGWGETMVTAQDGAKLIDALRDPPEWLDDDAAATIREYMSVSAETYDTSQAFGVGAMVQDDDIDAEDVYVKNGWLAEQDGQWSVSSVGAVTASACDFTISIARFGAMTSEEGMAAATTIAESLESWCEAD